MAAALLDLLAREGVRTCFGRRTSSTQPYWEAGDGDPDGDLRPRLIEVPSARMAGCAADVYARASAGLGVALTSAGSDAAEVVPAFGEAVSSGSPLVVIASERPGYAGRAKHDAMYDQASLFTAFGVPALRAKTPQEAVAMTLAAVITARRHPRKPVYVGVDNEVLRAVWGEVPLPDLPDSATPHPYLQAPVPGPDDLAALLGEVATHKRIAFWVGSGALSAGAGPALEALSARLGAPILTSRSARGLFSADAHVLDAPVKTPEAEAVLSAAELLIVWGSAFETALLSTAASLPARRIAIGLDEVALRARGPWDLLLGTEARVTAELLLAAAESRAVQRPAWASSARSMRGSVLDRLRRVPVTSVAMSLIDAIDDVWPTEGGIVCDSGPVSQLVSSLAAAKRPRRIHSAGWAGSGFALSGALGSAALGIPTLAISDDPDPGALAELRVAVQNRLPVVLVVAGQPSWPWRELAATAGVPVSEVGSGDAGASLRRALIGSESGPHVVVLHPAPMARATN